MRPIRFWKVGLVSYTTGARPSPRQAVKHVDRVSSPPERERVSLLVAPQEVIGILDDVGLHGLKMSHDVVERLVLLPQFFNQRLHGRARDGVFEPLKPSAALASPQGRLLKDLAQFAFEFRDRVSNLGLLLFRRFLKGFEVDDFTVFQRCHRDTRRCSEDRPLLGCLRPYVLEDILQFGRELFFEVSLARPILVGLECGDDRALEVIDQLTHVGRELACVAGGQLKGAGPMRLYEVVQITPVRIVHRAGRLTSQKRLHE